MKTLTAEEPRGGARRRKESHGFTALHGTEGCVRYEYVCSNDEHDRLFTSLNNVCVCHLPPPFVSDDCMVGPMSLC